jgi:transposase
MGEAEAALAQSGRRRFFRSPEQKRLIVEETLASSESVACIARRHGVNANQVFAWRKLYQRGLLLASTCEAEADEARLLPVAVVDEAAEVAEEETAAAKRAAAGSIHIEFPGRVSISVERGADLALVRAVLEIVRR